MAHRALQADEIETHLAELNAATDTPWVLRDGKLHKAFHFADFVAAFGFMTRIALIAERSNHHPEWFNVYRTVRVDLTTHDVKGISERDFALARAMDREAQS
jgi:4a-hydroxytetrahydrobiopterin dehydratase